MKVLYVTPGLGGGGGAERSLVSMARHWQDKLDLHVVTFSDRAELASQIIEAGGTVTNLGSAPLPIVVQRLRSTIRDVSPDLVHSVLFDADIAARLATPRGTPLSCSLVNVNYGRSQWEAPGRTRWKVGAAQLLDAVTAQRVTRFHSLSAEVATVMAQRLHIRESLIDVIPRGRDRDDVGYPSAERRTRVRQHLGIGDRPLIVATARHEWQKGLDVLLRAAPAIRAGIPDVAILVGGRPGTETHRLHQLARDCGLDPLATFIGSRGDVPDLMCAADAFCVPSRWEGLGSIMIEAMALGAPVVAADIAPIREIDPMGKWVQFFAPEESSTLAQKLIHTLTSPEGPARGRFAIEAFEAKYQASQIAERMADFFHRTVS